MTGSFSNNRLFSNDSSPSRAVLDLKTPTPSPSPGSGDWMGGFWRPTSATSSPSPVEHGMPRPGSAGNLGGLPLNGQRR